MNHPDRLFPTLHLNPEGTEVVNLNTLSNTDVVLELKTFLKEASHDLEIGNHTDYRLFQNLAVDFEVASKVIDELVERVFALSVAHLYPDVPLDNQGRLRFPESGTK